MAMHAEDFKLPLNLEIELKAPQLIFDEYLMGDKLCNYLRPVLFMIDFGTLKVSLKDNEKAPLF
jgi:hypothetical protein